MELALSELGLSEKEAKVYVALLELGPATVTTIAKKAGINRTTVYDIVASLLREGLINRVAGEKKETFKAEVPEKIPLILETRAIRLQRQVEKARKMVSELNLIASRRPDKPKVGIFEGKEGIKQLYEDTLLSREHIRSFSSTESLESFDQDYLHDYYCRRAAKGIFIQAIINDVPSAHDYKKQDEAVKREIRIVPKNMMDIRPEVYVYENKVAIFSLKEEFGVLVESFDIADALKKLYDLAWKQAGEKAKGTRNWQK